MQSWLSLRFITDSIWFDAVRDWYATLSDCACTLALTARSYEAYVLYTFFTLLIALLNGKDKLVETLSHKPPLALPFPANFVTMVPNEWFLQLCKLGLLQFVLVRPLLAVVSLSLHIGGVNLMADTLNPRGPALYISVLNNISVSISLYFLYVFYIVVKDDLARFKPWNMFLCIKAVIFFSYWQGVGLFLLQHAGVIKGREGGWTAEETALAIQDLLICIEMFCISLVHPYVFGFEQFVRAAEPGTLLISSAVVEPHEMPVARPVSAELAVKPILKNLKDVVNVADVIEDVATTVQPVTIGKHSKAV